MYGNSSYPVETFRFAPHQLAALKALSPEQFAALGTGSLVFVRTISGGELAQFVPQAGNAPDDAEFQMVMSADGTPILITDNEEAIGDWLEDKDIALVRRH